MGIHGRCCELCWFSWRLNLRETLEREERDKREREMCGRDGLMGEKREGGEGFKGVEREAGKWWWRSMQWRGDFFSSSKFGLAPHPHALSLLAYTDFLHIYFALFLLFFANKIENVIIFFFRHIFRMILFLTRFYFNFFNRRIAWFYARKSQR